MIFFTKRKKGNHHCNFLTKSILIMKFSFIFSFVSIVSLSASTYSQSTTFSFSLKNTTIEDVLTKIGQKSEFRLVYDNSRLELKTRVNIVANNDNIEQILDGILNNTDLKYQIFDKYIVISPRNEDAVISKEILQHKITGTITDASTKETLPGVNVVVEGTSIGTVTDLDGHFTINIPDPNATLLFSFIGYNSEKITLTGQSAVEMALTPEIQKLDEVVVVAYGTTKKKNLTGSISQIKMEDSPLELIPRTDAMDALRGTATGITVTQEQGAGQSPTLLVRGQKSINGGTDPLIVLDGVIYMGAMRDIDPSTIESINILKDATSVAAYGSRAANGVIIINTKKGKKGKPVINFQSSYGINKVINQAKVLSPENWIKKVNLLEGLNEDADPTSWMSEFETENYKKGKTVNWQDLVERTGHTQNYNLSVSGANEKTNYYLSGSYASTEGVLIGDDYSRIALVSNLTSNITDWLEIGGNMKYSFNDYSGPTNYDIYQAIRLTPYGRAYRDSTNTLLEKYPATEGIYRTNPLWSVKSGTIDDHDVYYTTVLDGHALVKVPWIKGLSFRLNYSYTNRLIERDYFTHEGYYIAEGTSDDRYSASSLQNLLAQANGYSARTNNRAYVWDNIINFSRTFDKHFVDFTGVYTRDSYNYNYKYITGSDFSSLGNTVLGYNGLPYAETQKISSFSNTLKNNIGYLGRLNYSYDNKYHLTASLRRDGSSVFGSNNKWGWFPSVGIAWTATEENFLKDIDPLNNLKVKVSWGKNGNQSLSPYGTLSFISLGQAGGYSYPFGNTSEVSWGQRITTLGNDNLGWEETSAFNAGIELSMLNNRINLNIDGYLSKTKNQIFTASIPVMANGITSMSSTMGQVNNRGLEISLNTVNIKNKDFEWSSTLTYYINRNILKDLYGDGKDDISNDLFLNKSLGAIYGYKQIGIVQTGDAEYIAANGAVAGDVKFWDKNNDGKITSDDRCILGYSKENFRMSFANILRYKNFELYALFTGIFGGNGYYKQTNIYAYRTASDVVSDNNFDHGWWTEENKSNKYPRIGYTDSRYTPVQDRSFVRLQNLSLSYNFHQAWIQKLNINNFRVYVAATNLLTITGWKGGDPETGQTLGSGYSYGYPLSSSYTFGVDLSF
jgi:TonB-dependent starch-binding outer membrane protein SusC